MATLIGVVALMVLAVWLLGGRRSPRRAAPEDDVTTPIDAEELARAEREVADDPEARSLDDGWEDDRDDWGPGTPR